MIIYLAIINYWYLNIVHLFQFIKIFFENEIIVANVQIFLFFLKSHIYNLFTFIHQFQINYQSFFFIFFLIYFLLEFHPMHPLNLQKIIYFIMQNYYYYNYYKNIYKNKYFAVNYYDFEISILFLYRYSWFSIYFLSSDFYLKVDLWVFLFLRSVDIWLNKYYLNSCFLEIIVF